MGRFLLSFLAALLVFVGGVWLWVALLPMDFLDREYGMWAAKMKMARHLPAGSVVILGDSRASAGMIPDRIGPDVYNLALGGASTLEVDALARTLSSSPRAVIFSISAFHCTRVDALWNRSVKYGLVNESEAEEFRKRAREFKEDILLGPAAPGDLETRLKITLFTHRFPAFYFSSLLAGEMFERKDDNLKIYQEVLASRGQHSYGTLDGCRDLCEEAFLLPAFVRSPVADSYLSDILMRFQKNNIPVYFIEPPVSDVSFAALKPGFVEQFAAYIKLCQERFPNFHPLGETLPEMPWSYFGDAGHLNVKGAPIFSDHVATLLRQARVEK